MPSAKLLWLLVPLLGVAELTAHLHFARSAPHPEEYAALGPVLEKLAEPGELIVMAPHWAEPNARFGLGERWMPLGIVARSDESAYRRAVEISILGQAAPELAGWTLVSSTDFGKFRLRLLENPAPQTVQYRFDEHLVPDELDVSLGGKGCKYKRNARVSNGALRGHATYPAKRFQCPGGEHMFVGATVIDSERFRPRACIWAHPGRKPLRLRFGRVPMAKRIYGYTGISELKAREGRGGSVKLTVSVNGEVVGETVHGDRDGWRRFEFETPKHRGRTAEVEFQISSSRPQWRHFCFQADTR